MANVASLGDSCPIVGCGSPVSKLDGPSLVCEKGHRLVNRDDPRGKSGVAAKSKREKEVEAQDG